MTARLEDVIVGMHYDVDIVILNGSEIVHNLDLNLQGQTFKMSLF